MFGFSKEQIRRYGRQIVLPDVGGSGQKKIQGSSVLIIGVGGLGSIASMYLAAAGVGKIGLVDSDVVDLSNLHRQIIYSTGDIGELKVDAASNVLKEINPEIRIDKIPQKLTPKNARSLVKKYDMIIDGTDNFPAKYLINDACVLERKPFVMAGVLQYEGQVITVIPRQTACYRCIFPNMPTPGLIPNCSEAGVLGPIPGFAACLQATEALKFMLGHGTRLLTDKMFIFNLQYSDFRLIRFERDEECPTCGNHAKDYLDERDYEENNECRSEEA
ncbi:MAG: HesA/MoeB/ThiF family protein [Candidatus Helarchaeota archaeon]